MTITPSVALSLIDGFASLVMLWAAARITTNAGFKTSDARWSMFRRCIYYGTTLSSGVLALRRGFDLPLDWWDVPLGCQFVFTLTIFPFLRATKFITQDRFSAVDGLREKNDDM
jgi:hypothetical protein